MAQQQLDVLAGSIGISKERFETKIKPLMDDIVGKGGNIGVALMRIDNSDLEHIEKVFCAFALGRFCGFEQIKQKVPGVVRKFIGAS